MPAMTDPRLSLRSADAPAALVVGTMNFGKRTPEAEARAIVARALDRGITAFDTANAYVGGESERILGRALAARRPECFVATKVGFGRTAGKPEGLSPARVLASIDESLERLGMDWVDVYYLHVPDYGTPIEATLEAMARVLESKKARAWGVSNYASWQILEMLSIADRAGMPRPVIAQQMYNVLIRQLDVEYFKFTARYPIHTTVYNPLAGGLLSGKHAPGPPPAGSRFEGNQLYLRRYWSEPFFAATAELRGIAEGAGMSLVDLAYAWLARRPGVDSILVGPGTVAHLDAAIDARERVLDGPTLAAVDAVHRKLAGTDATYAR
jgi:aryl-alcohol dehydrogenase-like predicted oxidoreductase